MLILSSVLLLILVVILSKANEKYPREWVTVCKNISTLMFFGAIIWLAMLLPGVIEEDKIDSQIMMLEEENVVIEKNINSITESYLKINPNAMPREELKTENAISLLILFPELKTDSYVLQQVEEYMKNIKTIKDLRKEKIELSTEKYLMFFGK